MWKWIYVLTSEYFQQVILVVVVLNWSLAIAYARDREWCQYKKWFELPKKKKRRYSFVAEENIPNAMPQG